MLLLLSQERPKVFMWGIYPPKQITANSSRSELFVATRKWYTVKSSGDAAFYIFPELLKGGERGHEKELEESIRDY